MLDWELFMDERGILDIPPSSFRATPMFLLLVADT